MTLDEYRIECGWSHAKMARAAEVDVQTVKRALKGEPITSNSAHKLARAISKELDQKIRYNQIDGLNVIL